jgi:hypothetical protein
MSDMQELVTVEQVEWAIRLVATALPAVGLALGAVVGAARRRLARGAILGLLCGMAGPGIWGLWMIYNGVVGVYGLDSVRGLLINLALFVVVGALVGIGAALAWRRLVHEPGNDSPHANE